MEQSVYLELITIPACFSANRESNGSAQCRCRSYYSESLSYDSAVSGLTGAVPSHTGKITVRTDTLDTTIPGTTAYSTRVGYVYYQMARLSSAVDAPNHTDYSYDQRSNMLSTTRVNFIKPNVSLQIQESYNYTGDRVTGIVVSIPSISYSFTHDALGRMTYDGRAGTTMEYNSLDKPRKVSSNGGTLVKYSYLAGRE